MAGDVDRWIAQWTDDGVQMPPNEPFVESKENIYARVGPRMQAGPTDEMVITALETQSAGDIAFLKSILEAEDIIYFVQGEHVAQYIYHSVPMRVLVDKKELAKAREILKDVNLSTAYSGAKRFDSSK